MWLKNSSRLSKSIVYFIEFLYYFSNFNFDSKNLSIVVLCIYFGHYDYVEMKLE